jgi:hypothetical protein
MLRGFRVNLTLLLATAVFAHSFFRLPAKKICVAARFAIARSSLAGFRVFSHDGFNCLSDVQRSG